MSSYSSSKPSAASASTEDGWTHVGRGGSKFSGDAATAFSRPPRRVATRAEFSEDASTAFGRPPSSASNRENRSYGNFGEEASFAFGRRGPGESRRSSTRAEFDETAASAFGGGSSRRAGFGDEASNVFGGGRKPRGGDTRYSHGISAVAPPPLVKKQTFEEAFPVLGGGGAAPTPVTVVPETERIPTLAEKLRKKVAEEAAEDERRAKVAEEAAMRRAAEARERAIFATLGASRKSSSHGRYHDDYEDDTAPANYEDDLECGAFGESTEQMPRGGAYIASKYEHDYEGFGEGEDDC